MPQKRVRPPQHHGQVGSTIRGRKRAQIIAWIDEGLTRNEIARRAGLSATTISGIAKAEGRTFDRSKTAAATEAHKVDMAARRAELAQGLLDDVEKLRSQLFAPTTLHAFGGKDNSHNSIDLAEPVYADKLKIVQAVGAAIDRHLKLDAHDQDEQGLTAVDAFLKGMLG